MDCSPRSAQTDEITPFCVRTSLAKKWWSPLWYNMYYNPTVQPYAENVWRYVLAGGRTNFHPPLGGNNPAWFKFYVSLAKANVLRADARVTLLNYISTAPVDCPVAMVFGHPSFLNWAGQEFGQAGVDVCDKLWAEGYYTDLIPSSEIANGSLKIARDGHIQYGPQRYAAVVLYHPDGERLDMADFFCKAANRGKTSLWRMGDWKMDFEGKSFRGNAALPPQMVSGDVSTCVNGVIARLKTLGSEPQTRSTMPTCFNFGFTPSMMPKPSGWCRLLDGTVILASGEKDVMGDPIQTTVRVQGHDVAFDAIGIAAVRLSALGKVEALAAGGLKSFQGGDLAIELAGRTDVALWRDAKGQWRGILIGSRRTHTRLPGPNYEPLGPTAYARTVQGGATHHSLTARTCRFNRPSSQGQSRPVIPALLSQCSTVGSPTPLCPPRGLGNVSIAV